MSNQKYSAKFREEAVRQVLDRGYAVKDVAKNLGVAPANLYKWVKQAKPTPEKGRDDELLEAKRDVLKLKARTATLMQSASSGPSATNASITSSCLVKPTCDILFANTSPTTAPNAITKASVASF